MKNPNTALSVKVANLLENKQGKSAAATLDLGCSFGSAELQTGGLSQRFNRKILDSMS